MDTLQIEYPTDWTEYELIDSGEGEKLENFGGYVLSRPDPRVLWPKSVPSAWRASQATYANDHWTIRKNPPSSWKLSYKHLIFTLRPTQFKHLGVFPEQAVNWKWIHNVIQGRPLKILNLFAYTGGASMAAAAAGAHVTHVDSVKSAIDWAHENVRASKLDDAPIRWIEEDAMKFVTREIKRGNVYDGIIMDPPRFGRGTKGEVWKLEDNLAKLIAAAKQLLSSTPVFIHVNAYTADLSSIALGNLLGTREFGELALKDKSGKLLPNGIFARVTFEPPR